MPTDRYGNALTTDSAAAADAYIVATDAFLSANFGALCAVDDAVAADPDFALGHVLRARVLQFAERPADAKASMEAAYAAQSRRPASAREASHISVYDALIAGRGAEARKQIMAHAADYPRDALVVQPATGVFGLIGFSGCDGREAEQLAFVRGLETAYGDDWWFLGQLAFAEAECGAIDRSIATIDRSLEGNPRNANAAHIKSHIHYEQGECAAGRSYLDAWTVPYDRRATLFGHVNWHRALWALEQGDTQAAWAIIDDAVLPGCSPSPSINVLTDSASFLFRAEIAGEPRRDDLWRQLAEYAAARFPSVGVVFADFHAALVYAMSGETARLEKLTRACCGPTADVVRLCATGFEAFAQERFADAARAFAPVLSRHETLGGSRAQRDLLEFAYAAALLRMGAADEAARALTLRRPRLFADRPDAFQGRLATPQAAPVVHASQLN
ncbi:MAG: tetratricopeptide repeat protein [Pseudomonadota bacterium]